MNIKIKTMLTYLTSIYLLIMLSIVPVRGFLDIDFNIPGWAIVFCVILVIVVILGIIFYFFRDKIPKLKK